VPLGRAVLEGSENTPSFRKLQNTVTGQPRIRSEVLDVSPAAMEARMGATIEGGGERGGFKGVKYAYAGAGDANTRAPTAGAVDTKNMGSTRLERPTRDSHRSAEAFATGAVDARNLGARPEGVGSSLMRNLRRTPSERIGLEEKQRFPPRPEGESRSDHPRNSSGYQGQVPRREDGIRSDQPRSEDGTQQRQSLPQRREDDLNTDHASSEDHIQERTSRFVRDSLRRDGRFRNDQPRSGSGIQERAPQREGQGRAAFNRAPIGDGPPQRRGRPGRPRTARHGDGDGEPKRRKASNFKENRRGKGDRDARLSEPVWDEEEKEYFKQKTKAETQKSLEFDPGNITQQTFSGVAPALVSGIQGMSEVLIERLMLAKRYLEGGFIQWDSKEQRADVMTLVERLKTLDEQGQHDNDGKKGEPLLLRTEDQTQALMQKLLGGKYEMVKPQQGKDVLANVARHVDRNESYFPDDQRSLLEKVRSILPMEGTRSTGKSAKQAAEERCIIEPTWHR
jgi:hypothetical protein